MTTSLEEARRFLSLARDNLAAFLALAALKHIRPALAFFHAQQAIEMSLKAVLFAHGLEFPKTHDLYELADHLDRAGITLPIDAGELARINPYAVEFRYGEETLPNLSQNEVEAMATRMLAWAEATVWGMAP